MNDRSESTTSLWWLIASPTVWAVHFLLSYLTVAIGCTKFGSYGQTADIARWAVGAYTAIALVVMIGIARVGLHWHYASGKSSVRHDDDTFEDRVGFLGFATVLLTGLSIVATIFVALVAWFVRGCQ